MAYKSSTRSAFAAKSGSRGRSKRASHDGYNPACCTPGDTAGSPEDALDTACGLYLNDPLHGQTPKN